MDALERVEVAIRAALTDHMSTTHGNPHWYTKADHFKNVQTHHGLLRIIERTCSDQLSGAPDTGQDTLVHGSALEHYLTTYGSPELPPSWLMVETLTIGQLHSVYKNLRVRADRTAIAAAVGLNSTVLESWLKTYVRVRNVCAHHGRLWNVGLGVYPAIPTTPRISWLRGDVALPERSRMRLYPVLVSLQSVLDVISPNSTWALRLQALLDTRPAINLAGMGVPANWSHDEFWRRHLA